MPKYKYIGNTQYTNSYFNLIDIMPNSIINVNYFLPEKLTSFILIDETTQTNNNQYFPISIEYEIKANQTKLLTIQKNFNTLIIIPKIINGELYIYENNKDLDCFPNVLSSSNNNEITFSGLTSIRKLITIEIQSINKINNENSNIIFKYKN